MMGRGVRLIAAIAAALIAVGLLPVTFVAAISVAAAWRNGWPPGRLYRAAAWCLPMLAVWLAAIAISRHSLGPAAAAPHLAWLDLRPHQYLAAAALLAPPAMPARPPAGRLAWTLP